MESNIKMRLTPTQVKPFAVDGASFEDLNCVGVALDEAAVKELAAFYDWAADEAPNSITTPSVASALQFLQYFAAPVTIATQARVADDLLGRTIAGSWEDEQIVVPVLERVGQARPYGDDANVPLASFNQNFEGRTIVRMELGLQANALEMARAAKMRIDSVSVKRDAIANALAITVNDIAFNGFNGGNNHTYGILNDPGLSNYVSVSTGAASATEWANKTFAEITADIRAAFQSLRTQSGGLFVPERDACTLGIAMSAMEALAYSTDYGYTVKQFITDNYPKCRIVSVPQFDAANGGDNVFYIIADSINGRKVAEQYIQQELYLLGTQPLPKGIIEDYSNATAGAVVIQPIGVVRYTGI